MTERWSRRALLASIGAVAVAGCTSSDGPGGTAPPTDSPTPAPTPTRTASPTDVHTVSGTDRDGTPSTTETASPGSPTETGAATPDGTPTAPASVGSDWPVPGADAGRSNAVPAAGPTEAVAELWRVSAGTSLSAPVLAGSSVYVGGDDGTVRALDAATGESRWSVPAGDSAGTTRVVDGSVFVPVDGGLVALAPGDGREQWRVDTPDRRGLLVATHGVYWVDESGPTVVALGLDGDERWRTDIADPWEPRVFASEDRVFISSGPYDSRFWRLTVDTGEQLNRDPRRGADFPAEQCYRDGTVYAVDAFFGNVDATAVTDTGSGWRASVPPGGEAGGGLVAVGADRVYYTANVDDEPGLTALSRSDGRVAWTAEVSPTILGRPAVGTDSVVVPTTDGLRGFDPADGNQQWASGVDVGDRGALADDLVFTTVDGSVVAYRPP
ncbi:MAG: PQQ-binding-like beta-propeller repeat protein [Haloarculaceae archaeon]